jgi:hypothetical protein
MTFQEYLAYFNRQLENPTPPYDQAEYAEYTRLNWARTQRWVKNLEVSPDFKNRVTSAQEWIVITEPWCGDAAHSVPVIQKIAELNPLVTVRYELRDAAPHRIEQYLTNGGKSIPKLIVRNAEGLDLFTWGPRPQSCQEVFLSMDKEVAKVELQKWYNADKGLSTQAEILSLLS